MKLNWAERLVVNNPGRAMEQGFLIRWMRRAMPLEEGLTILEVGCGRGAGAGLILEEFRPAELHAMDLDIRMIRKAGRYLSRRHQEKTTLYTADALHLPYRDGTLDVVFGFGVLHHVPDWQAALAEIARVLKTGGVYFIEELYPTLYQNFITRHILLHPTENRFRSRDFREALAAARFQVKDSLEVKAVGILAVCVKTV
jgi:ubiquinone/menaquinone biosynthesis C-methylase UbiE